MSLSGTLYCYRNPLASNGEKLRNPWYDTTCCPPNVERLFESLPGYFYAMGRDGVYVNLYQTSELDWHLEDGTRLKLSQTTNYPWAGDIHLTVNPDHASDFTVYLRWPAWAASADVQVNGQAFTAPDSKRGSYIAIERTWNRGDAITLNLALQRGPLVYTLEQIDQGGAALGDLFVRASGPVTVDFRKDLLGGVSVLKIPGQAAERSLGEEPLYQPLATAMTRIKRPVTLTFIPYYAMGNREPTPMEVWVPISRFDNPVSAATAANIERHP
jgi:DUF1680 family protein